MTLNSLAIKAFGSSALTPQGGAQAREEESSAQARTYLGQGVTSLSNSVFPQHVGTESMTLNSLAIKAFGSSALTPQGGAQAREEESTNPVFGDESEKRHKLRELFTMKNIISTLIAQEVPRLDANPPPPPRSKSSATSKTVPAYTKTTARNESEDDGDTFEDAPGTDEISTTADKPSAVKKRRSTK